MYKTIKSVYYSNYNKFHSLEGTMKTKKYGWYDLGFGIHISEDPFHREAILPNAFIVHNSLGKIYPPECSVLDQWDIYWTYLKQQADNIVKALNNGGLTEAQASKEIEQLNNDMKNNEVTI